MTEIATMLRQEVEQRQIISFARFMELALYCPDFGYYEQEESRIGPAGDFYTSVSTGSLFGELLARQFCAWLGEGTHPVQLVEAGAHDGRLAGDVLGWFRAHRPDRFQRLRYYLVEPSCRRRAWQEATLAEFAGSVSWVDRIEELGPAGTPGQRRGEGAPGGVEGVIFSNEFLDAFPVHRLVWDAGTRTWNELGVGWQAGGFVWRRMRPTADWQQALQEAGLGVPPELAAVLPEGFTLDWSPLAGEWWRQAARVLRSGRLLTFDYGLTNEEWLTPHRSQGTLRAYQGHQVRSDPLADPGQQDLTAHIHFSPVRLAGEREHLRTEGLISQARFLTPLANERWLETAPSSSEARQFQALTHPDHLGRAFRAFIQSRGNGEGRGLGACNS